MHAPGPEVCRSPDSGHLLHRDSFALKGGVRGRLAPVCTVAERRFTNTCGMETAPNHQGWSITALVRASFPPRTTYLHSLPGRHPAHQPSATPTTNKPFYPLHSSPCGLAPSSPSATLLHHCTPLHSGLAGLPSVALRSLNTKRGPSRPWPGPHSLRRRRSTSMACSATHVPA